MRLADKPELYLEKNATHKNLKRNLITALNQIKKSRIYLKQIFFVFTVTVDV